MSLKSKATAQKKEYKGWEKVLLIVCLIFGALLVAMLLNQTTLRKYFLGEDSLEAQEMIGKVTQTQGSLERQASGELIFQPIKRGEQLFNQDTLMSGPNGLTQIEFNDGNVLELEPRTLIQLKLDSRVSFEQGVRRRVVVELGGGKVTVKNDTASATPILLKVKQNVTNSKDKKTIESSRYQPRIMNSSEVEDLKKNLKPKYEFQVTGPENQSSLPVLIDEQGQISGIFKINWSLDQKSVLKLYDQQSRVLFTQTLEEGVGNKEIKIKKSGNYSWSLGEKTGFFNLSQKHVWVEVLQPEIKQNADESIQSVGDIKLKWRLKIPSTVSAGSIKNVLYLLEVKDSNGKLLYQEKTRQNEKLLPKDRLWIGRVHYQIKVLQLDQKITSSFELTSPDTTLVFKYLSPIQKNPEDGSEVLSQEFHQDYRQKGVLFTWQRLKFSDEYQIEIALDSNFETVLKSYKTKQNFYIIKDLASGTFFWRVRSHYRDQWSEAGVPFRIKVQEK